jgi:hypothetical protein
VRSKATRKTRLAGRRSSIHSLRRFQHLFLAAVAFALLVLAAPALASKQAVDFFGGDGTSGGQFTVTRGTGVAVNETGAGPANAGDIYVTDDIDSRIERFGRNDNGTPADANDDSYFFISAWGAGVQSSGSEYEICTVAASCHAAVASGGNGTPAGNGALSEPEALAVDQDTGDVYVSDKGNHRVNVYAGDGAFLRSFGYDVVASGPGHVAGPDERQLLTVKADGSKFSLSFEGKATAPRAMSRSADEGQKNIAIERMIEGTFTVGEVVSGQNIQPGTTITGVTSESISISKPTTNAFGPQALFGDELPFNAPAAEVEAALNALPSIGVAGGSVVVSGGPGDAGGSSPYAIDFGGSLAGEDVPPIEPESGGLQLASGVGSAAIAESVKGGAYEICEAAAGDVCQGGRAGAAPGEIGEGGPPNHNTAEGIAVSAPDGNPATGAVFLADTANQRVNSYGLDGASPSSFGSAATFAPEFPRSVAVDSRGVVYASNNEGGVERYDSQNANGSGVSFLAPIPVGVDERQEVTIAATAGTFRLSFEGQSTGDLPFNASETEIVNALKALPTIGPGNFECCAVGGPGNASGSNPYRFTFSGGLGAKAVPQFIVSNGSTPLSGGAGASVTTTVAGQDGLVPEPVKGLAVAPDADGAGPEADVLYVQHEGDAQQFGPLNAPGLLTPPTADDDRHGTNSAYQQTSGIAVEPSTGRLYVAASSAALGHGVFVLDNTGNPPPTASLDSLSDPTSHSVVAHATIDPNGPPATSYHFEYSTDGSNWTSMPTVLLGSQEAPQSIEATIDSPPLGLQPSTLYHVRLVAGRKFGDPIVTPELTTTTLAQKPLVETTGTPIRTTSTAQLQGRVDPSGLATTYHFEYGSAGACDANPCTATPDRSAGSGSVSELAAEQIEGLTPGTTYHYRLVADNGFSGPATAGGDATVTTRSSDAPLAHGHFPGPPGSDRAWELVSLPDSSGNPVGLSQAFANDGDRAIYGIFGGTPSSSSGSLLSLYFSERTQSGWKSKQLSPSRDEVVGPGWIGMFGDGDLSTVVARNNGDLSTNAEALWRLSPTGPPQDLFKPVNPQGLGVLEGAGNGGYFGLSADGSRAVATLRGGVLDPAYPAAASQLNFYDVSSGTPRLVSLLPGNEVAPCGAATASGKHPGAFGEQGTQTAHWISADGSLVVFPSQGKTCGAESKLYLRDIPAGETKLIGPGGLLKMTADAIFFTTGASLQPGDEGGNDVYRYDLGDESLECVTCVYPNANAEVQGSGPAEIAVSEDGSRVYFSSSAHLLAGAPPKGTDAIYRVRVADGDLAYVAPGGSSTIGTTQPTAALTLDGTQLVFESNLAALNPLGGAADNGGTAQYYRYDDRDRSLTCVSCPQDGAAPLGSPGEIGTRPEAQGQSNLTALSDDGTIAFATPTPLVGADQNTPAQGGDIESGTDVYEWRDGRLFLVTDGLSDWSLPPAVQGMSPSGKDIYFSATAQYTPDALDANRRLYDARIGGGIEFPVPPKPCPLEVCQGTPKGAPEEQAPGSGSFSGSGNVATQKAATKRPAKKHHKRHRKHAKKHALQHKANSNRRAAR